MKPGILAHRFLQYLIDKDLAAAGFMTNRNTDQVFDGLPATSAESCDFLDGSRVERHIGDELWRDVSPQKVRDHSDKRYPLVEVLLKTVGKKQWYVIALDLNKREVTLARPDVEHTIVLLTNNVRVL